VLGSVCSQSLKEMGTKDMSLQPPYSIVPSMHCSLTETPPLLVLSPVCSQSLKEMGTKDMSLQPPY